MRLNHRQPIGRPARPRLVPSLAAVALLVTVHASRDAGVAFCQAAGQAQHEQDAEAIRAAAKRYQDALAKGDGTTLASLWTADGDIVDDQGKVLKARETVALASKADGTTQRPVFRITETNLSTN